MNTNVGIFITSRSRTKDQPSLKSLHSSLHSITSLVVPLDEKSLYARWSQQFPDIQMLYTQTQHLAQKRQWILNEIDVDKIILLDDDLIYFQRKEPGKIALEGQYHEQSQHPISQSLFNWVITQLDHYAHVGVSAREMNHFSIEPIAHNTRAMRILAYRRDVLRDEKLRFDDVTVMSDFHMTLNLFERGYENIVSHHYAHNQRGSNAEGGCSVYRTADMMKEGAHLLQSLHPRVVRVVGKQTKTAWKHKMDGQRTDVRIQWKKALNPNLKQVTPLA